MYIFNFMQDKFIKMKSTIQIHSQQKSQQKIVHFDLELHRQSLKNRSKSTKARQTLNNSLPSITPYSQVNKKLKINIIRRQTFNAQEQIGLMKARIHTLKQMKSKCQSRKQKSLEKIQFIQTVRDRKNNQSANKLKYNEEQNQNLEQLRQKARQLRQGMKKQIQKARQTLYFKNQLLTLTQKRLKNQFSTNILQNNQKQLIEKLIKATKIKQQQLLHKQKIKQFKESRIKFAQHNHISKAEKELQQKEKKEKSLKKLRKEQDKLMYELKQAQKQYQDVINSVEINPETNMLPWGRGSRINHRKHTNSREIQSGRKVPQVFSLYD